MPTIHLLDAELIVPDIVKLNVSEIETTPNCSFMSENINLCPMFNPLSLYSNEVAKGFSPSETHILYPTPSSNMLSKLFPSLKTTYDCLL